MSVRARRGVPGREGKSKTQRVSAISTSLGT
jgi:hypothetical protein